MECGGDGVPLTYVEFEVKGARPIDVFNVMVDAEKQPNWDSSCRSMVPLGEWQGKRMRAFAGTFPAPPLASREAYEWQAANASFETEEFWVLFSTVNNEELEAKRDLDSGAIKMQNCLAAYKMSKSKDGGTHVITSQQINSHPWPLKSRQVQDMAFGTTLTWVNSLKTQVAAQVKLGWNSTRTTAPAWMLQGGEENCTVPKADTAARDVLLEKAAVEFARAPSQRGEARPTRKMSNGQDLNIWRRDGVVCGAGAVADYGVPLFQAEFVIPDATPADVFNVLIAKRREADWNSKLVRADVLDFKSGARSVHEAFTTGLPMLANREIWEHQAASHDLVNGSYNVVLTSTSEETTGKFDSWDAEAAQCLAAYTVSPSGAGGSKVRTTTHFNPNIWGETILSHLSALWAKAGEDAVADFAEALRKQAEAFAAGRKSGDDAGLLWQLDGDAMRLLAPAPVDRNESVTLAHVAAARQRHERERLFSQLDIPVALNASAGNFDARAEELLGVLRSFAANATEAENATFKKGKAEDPVELQRQGVALTAMQVRVTGVVAQRDCDSGSDPMPDINKDGADNGMPLETLAAVVITVVLLGCIGTALCCIKVRRSRSRQREGEAAAAGLMENAVGVEAAVQESAVS
eukprot:TRINITY_DN30360_c0_g1_i6.p1 TRINITY_DN30360_c0_g1~~TRINITY_DN30360_c0_g1_i6.p1  ORF type:complete len:635 (+),score=170.58 TRINITY_DN30360_c0_g1_i6:783-2687(+)